MSTAAQRDPALADGYSQLLPWTQVSSATSEEAKLVQDAVVSVMETGERSIALFGDKTNAITKIWELVKESEQESDESDWISELTAKLAADFIRALPADLPLPELGLEPDGYLSLDWMPSRHRIFSVAVGRRARLPYAWVDGSDRGHAVALFDQRTVPARILEGIRRIASPAAPIRTA